VRSAEALIEWRSAPTGLSLLPLAGIAIAHPLLRIGHGFERMAIRDLNDAFLHPNDPAALPLNLRM
jgi:hypothetical protein